MRTIRLTDAQHSALVAALMALDDAAHHPALAAFDAVFAERLYGTPQHEGEWTQQDQDEWTAHCEQRDADIQAVVDAVGENPTE